MPAKKKTSPQAEPFLKTAAEAIGTALGKLAVRTGVATRAMPSRKRKTAPAVAKKKATSPGKKAIKKTVKKSAR